MRYLLLLTLFPILTFSQNISDHTHSANLYLEAGQFDEAIRIYRKSFDFTLNPWQRSFILANLGLAYINSDQLDRGIQDLEAILVDKDSSPILVEKIHETLAYAYLLKAETLKNLKSIDSIVEAFKFLEMSQGHIKEANVAFCSVLRLKGYSDCFVSFELLQLAKAVYSLQTELMKQNHEKLFADATLRSIFPYFFDSLLVITRYSALLLSPQFPKESQDEWLTFLLEIGTSWKQPITNIPEASTVWLIAADLYMYGLEALYQKNHLLAFSSFNDSLTLIASMKDALQKELKSEFEFKHLREKEEEEIQKIFYKIQEMQMQDQVPLEPAPLKQQERPW